MFFTQSPLLIIAGALEGPLSESLLGELGQLRDWCLERLETLSRGRWLHTADIARELQESYELVACACDDVLEAPELALEAAQALREASRGLENLRDSLEILRDQTPLVA